MKKLVLALIPMIFLVGCGGGGGGATDDNSFINANLNQEKNDTSDIFNFKSVNKVKVDGQVINYAISLDGKYLYATTMSPVGIDVFSREIESGKLTKIQSITADKFVNGKNPRFNPHGIVVSPDGKQVYISASFGIVADKDLPFGNHLIRFDVDSLGQLNYNNTLLVKDNFDVAYNVQMKDSGDVMYIGANGSIISTIKRTPNGDISLLPEIKKDINAHKFGDTQNLFLSPDNQNLYVSSSSVDGHLYVFDIDKNSGALINKETFVSLKNTNSRYLLDGDKVVHGGGGTGVDISSDGRFFYSVGGHGDVTDSISIFNRDQTGGLSFVKSVQAPISEDPAHRILFANNSHLIISPNQQYIYTYDGIIETLGVWKRDTNSGDLSYKGKVNNIDNKGNNNKLLVSPDGKYLYLNADEGFMVYGL